MAVQDVHGHVLDFCGVKNQALFFVLDGHNGKEAAEFLGTVLPEVSAVIQLCLQVGSDALCRLLPKSCRPSRSCLCQKC